MICIDQYQCSFESVVLVRVENLLEPGLDLLPSFSVGSYSGVFPTKTSVNFITFSFLMKIELVH